MQEVYMLPASEILGWEKHFTENPTTSEKLDWVIVLLATSISDFRNAHITKGRLTQPKDFIPAYLLGDEPEVRTVEKSLEEQNADWAAFRAKYQQVKKGG